MGSVRAVPGSRAAAAGEIASAASRTSGGRVAGAAATWTGAAAPRPGDLRPEEDCLPGADRHRGAVLLQGAETPHPAATSPGGVMRDPGGAGRGTPARPVGTTGRCVDLPKGAKAVAGPGAVAGTRELVVTSAGAVPLLGATLAGIARKVAGAEIGTVEVPGAGARTAHPPVAEADETSVRDAGLRPDGAALLCAAGLRPDGAVLPCAAGLRPNAGPHRGEVLRPAAVAPRPEEMTDLPTGDVTAPPLAMTAPLPVTTSPPGQLATKAGPRSSVRSFPSLDFEPGLSVARLLGTAVVLW